MIDSPSNIFINSIATKRLQNSIFLEGLGFLAAKRIKILKYFFNLTATLQQCNSAQIVLSSPPQFALDGNAIQVMVLVVSPTTRNNNLLEVPDHIWPLVRPVPLLLLWYWLEQTGSAEHWLLQGPGGETRAEGGLLLLQTGEDLPPGEHCQGLAVHREGSEPNSWD